MSHQIAKLSLVSTLSSILSLFLVPHAYAQEADIPWSDLLDTASPRFNQPGLFLRQLFGGGGHGGETSAGLLTLSIIFAGLILLLMIIAGGFTMLTNPTNPEAQAKGKARITYGLIGFLVVFGTYWIAQILEVMFNLNIV